MNASLTRQDNDTLPARAKKNCNGIDLIKFVCALLVFLIHVDLFPEGVSVVTDKIYTWISLYLCRIAVPFFFVSAGFFLFRKMPQSEINADLIKNYCFKLLRVSGIWYMLLFFGRNDHLWYLEATVVAVILVSLCFYFRIKTGYIFTLAIVLYAIGLIGDSYEGLVEPLAGNLIFASIAKGYTTLFDVTRNGVFMGFIFVLMGASFAWRPSKMRPLTAMAGFAVSMLCMLGEAYLLMKNEVPGNFNMYVFLLPSSYFLFAFACNVELRDRPIYRKLRVIGVLIYFSHLIVEEFVYIGTNGVNKLLGVNLEFFHFPITLLATLFFAILIQWLSQKEKFKWLNWLTS